MNILPKPKKLEIKDGFLRSKELCIKNLCQDLRVSKALDYFNTSSYGAELIIECGNSNLEGYTLKIEENAISIKGDGAAGAFYAIQTLKQIFEKDNVPCLYIEDKPDMEYRGFYHDVTRGKVPTLQSLKKLVDTLAYYKMNSLQIYVEHTFPFKELGDLIEKTGYLSKEEIKELDDYCYENFIEFIPSIATFGHLFELLERDEYKHLQVLDNYVKNNIFYRERMNHHTIDPKKEESFEIIKSLIDQYMPLFKSDKFNLCGDETFDLSNGKYKDEDVGRLYIDFVKKIIAYLESKGKKPMMWGDILLKHTEVIGELPKNIEYLNWWYGETPDESWFEEFRKTGSRQIVCPGTSSWAKLIENARLGENNINIMLDLGYKYGAFGMLNTNWGDYGHPCSIELSMHGLIFGAAKAWNKSTKPGMEFNNAINEIEYKNTYATDYIYTLGRAQNSISWYSFANCYAATIYEGIIKRNIPTLEEINESISICQGVIEKLSLEKWEKDKYRTELILAAKGIMVMAELFAQVSGYDIKRISDTSEWLKEFKESWLESNKESELSQIEKMFLSVEKYYSKTK